jgi:hypothetical protein
MNKEKKIKCNLQVGNSCGSNMGCGWEMWVRLAVGRLDNKVVDGLPL